MGEGELQINPEREFLNEYDLLRTEITEKVSSILRSINVPTKRKNERLQELLTRLDNIVNIKNTNNYNSDQTARLTKLSDVVSMLREVKTDLFRLFP